MSEMRKFRCSDCQHAWELPYGTGRPLGCPSCKSDHIHRAAEDRGYASRLRREQGRCWRGIQEEK